jgi:hypothetical protein
LSRICSSFSYICTFIVDLNFREILFWHQFSCPTTMFVIQLQLHFFIILLFNLILPKLYIWQSFWVVQISHLLKICLIMWWSNKYEYDSHMENIKMRYYVMCCHQKWETHKKKYGGLRNKWKIKSHHSYNGVVYLMCSCENMANHFFTLCSCD